MTAISTAADCPSTSTPSPSFSRCKDGPDIRDESSVSGGSRSDHTALDVARRHREHDLPEPSDEVVLGSLFQADWGELGEAPRGGATCYLRFPGYPSQKFDNMWDFLLRELGAGAKAKAVPGGVGGQERLDGFTNRCVSGTWRCSVHGWLRTVPLAAEWSGCGNRDQISRSQFDDRNEGSRLHDDQH